MIVQAHADCLTSLIRTIEATCAGGSAKAKHHREALQLAAGLEKLAPESRHRQAYNSVVQDAAFYLGPTFDKFVRAHLERCDFNDRESCTPELFLESLVEGIEALIDNAACDDEDEPASERSAGPARDAATSRASAFAENIARKKAEEGAREAGEEAYRLAYQWAYEDIFEEAYEEALSQTR